MSIVENLTKYTCNMCGKIEYIQKDSEPPMQEYCLPMRKYTNTGSFVGMINQRIDLCRSCSQILERILSEHYYMCSIDGVDVSIKNGDTKGYADGKGEWTSIAEDGFPKEEGEYFVWNAEQRKREIRFFFRLPPNLPVETNPEVREYFGNSADHKKITHWMPLPEPPKGE